MPKPPPVEYIITRPAPASWWRRNRHIVLLCIGLFLGYQLCNTTGANAEHRPDPGRQPRPTHSTPAGSDTVKPLPTPS